MTDLSENSSKKILDNLDLYLDPFTLSCRVTKSLEIPQQTSEVGKRMFPNGTTRNLLRAQEQIPSLFLLRGERCLKKGRKNQYKHTYEALDRIPSHLCMYRETSMGIIRDEGPSSPRSFVHRTNTSSNDFRFFFDCLTHWFWSQEWAYEECYARRTMYHFSVKSEARVRCEPVRRVRRTRVFVVHVARNARNARVITYTGRKE